MPHTLGDNERVAAEDDRNVMMPPRERAALIMVQAKLPLQFLISLLGTPALLEDADDLLFAHPAWQRCQREFRRFLFPLWPFNDQPLGLSVIRLFSFVVSDLNPPEHESRGELAARTISPCPFPECARPELDAELLRAYRFAFASVPSIEQPNTGRCCDSHGEVQPILSNSSTKVSRGAIGSVCENNISWQAVLDRSRNHSERELRLRLEFTIGGNPRRHSAWNIVNPAARQVQLDVDRHMSRPVRDAQAHTNLAIGNFARRPGILALNADRMRPLFKKSRIIDDPNRERVLARHSVHHIARRLPTYIMVTPWRISHEVQEMIMEALRLVGVRRSAGRDRLHALSRPLTQNTERVHRERLSLLLSPQVRADARKKSVETLLALASQLISHATISVDTLIENVNTTQGFVEDKVRNKRQMTTVEHRLSRAAFLNFLQ